MPESVFRGPLGIAIVSSLFFGCSRAPAILAKNEINEPVFRESHYLAVGGEASYDSPWEDGTDFGSRHHFQVLPYVSHAVLVSPWAGFSFWPLFWNFRLTGGQYAADGELKTGALLLALHGGVTGFAYSQREGWLFTGAVSLDGKYRFGAAWFADAEADAQSLDLASLEDRLYGFSAGLGNQVSARNSLKLAARYDYFDLTAHTAFEDHALSFRKGDTRWEASLNHSFYPTPRHALGPRAGIAFRDGASRKGYYLTLGLHYDFRFR